MQQNRFRSQFVHRQSEKAGDENVDGCKKAWRCRYCDDFSHDDGAQLYAGPHAFVKAPG